MNPGRIAPSVDGIVAAPPAKTDAAPTGANADLNGAIRSVETGAHESRVAIAAAEAAAAATAELLRFAREGEQSDSFAFAEETTALLASALQASLRLEYPRACKLAAEHGDQSSPEAIDAMLGALTRFLEVFSA